MHYPLQSILAATDLGPGSDALVSSAARLAASTGAELHLLYSLDLPRRFSDDAQLMAGFSEKMEEAEGRLLQQARRMMPEGRLPASGKVFVYTASRAILDRAKEVSADLIVVGPHRAGAAGAHFLGTTADYVIRTAEVPCLVVDEPLKGNIQRIGVPIDCSDPSSGALEVALTWGLQFGQGVEPESSSYPEIRVMHAGWVVEQIDNPDWEERVLRPELEEQVKRAVSRVPGAEVFDIEVEVCWGNNATEQVVRWAARNEIDIIVMGTRGSTGLKRALLGSTASRVARQAPRPVLLVPPALWSGQAHTIGLERITVATDFQTPALDAARWCVRELAPNAEHFLVHVLEVPEPGRMLTSRYGSREELLRTARKGARQRLDEMVASLKAPSVRSEVGEGQPADEIIRMADKADTDLLVIGGHGDPERNGWTVLGTTAERVLRASTVPVLATRGSLQGPPRNLLVAVDGSESSLRALAWADFLRRQFGGACTAIHVESPIMYQYADAMPVGVGAVGYESELDAELRTEWEGLREDWLREQVQRANVDPETITLRVAIGGIADEILAEQERGGADLIVMGTHGRGPFLRMLLGSTAGAVLRRSSRSVLIVPANKRA